MAYITYKNLTSDAHFWIHLKSVLFIRAATDDDDEMAELVARIGNEETNTNKYQHLLLLIEEEMPNAKHRCQMKYANILMNRFSIRTRDRFEVCGIQTVKVPNIFNTENCSAERENVKKERESMAGEQVRVRNITFWIISLAV